MSQQDFCVFEDDFVGDSLSTLWNTTETSGNGTMVIGIASPTSCGAATVGFDNTSEIQNGCVDFGDKLCFDIDDLISVEFRIKIAPESSALDAATSLAFGLQSARNDNPDSTANNAQFRCLGADAVVVETDDGTTDTDDVATGKSLTTSYKKCVISFAAGKSDVRFYIDGERVAAGTTFDMSAATGSLQLFVQLQKTADTNTDAVVVDLVRVESRRPLS